MTTTASSATIDLMRRHVSVRDFTAETIGDATLTELLEAGRAASSWRHFQSYSIIVVRDPAQKQRLSDLTNQPSVRNCAVFLVFVGDLARARTAVEMHGGTFDATGFDGAGVESLLITAVDASLVAQNVLLAAESIGLGGVFIGMIRTRSAEFSELLHLPDHTYPLMGLALGHPASRLPVKDRLPASAVVFPEHYHLQTPAALRAFDDQLATYPDPRGGTAWSQRFESQWGGPGQASSTECLRSKGILR